MLKTRALTIAVLLPLFIAAIFYFPTTVWALLLTLLAVIGAWEWAALAGWRGISRGVYLAVVASGVALLWMFATGDAPPANRIAAVVLGISVIFWLVVVPLWLAKGWAVRAPLIMAAAGLIVLLPTWLALVRLHAQPAVLLALMAIVWISDTAAYLCGRQWGRRKLAPAISPGKTWEGAAGAVITVAVYYAMLQAVGWTAGWAGHGVLQGLAGCMVFLLLVILGIEGDLFESWVKRTAGVKDSGTIFPGHGGVLDRIDALTSSMPAAALLLSVLGERV
jgi:phosphatidate cytidylyltransferase